MYILAFETSCDDTSVALMKDGALISMSTKTQLEHDITGWVVPEVAARSHANAIFPCIEEVLHDSGLKIEDIDVIACTEKPWLLPSLLTGLTVAKTLSLSLGKPLILVDHIESHMFANLLDRDESEFSFPAVVLTVSGGHTEIYHWKDLFTFEILWQTRDDAAGECFDKVAKMLGLGFPGWAKIAKLAWEYRMSQWFDPDKKNRLFPVVLLEKDSLDFSFSGLKSAVKREIDERKMKCFWEDSLSHPEIMISENDMREISFEVEESITDILSIKLIRAFESMKAEMMCLAGWVSANTILKEKLEKYSREKWIHFLSPKKILYSMDNAAMVGIRAYYQLKNLV